MMKLFNYSGSCVCDYRALAFSLICAGVIANFWCGVTFAANDNANGSNSKSSTTAEPPAVPPATGKQEDKASPFAYQHFRQAMALRQGLEPERALVEFSKAIELKPDYLQAYLERGRAYTDVENFRAAMSDLNFVAAHKSPFAGQALVSIADIYRAKPDFRKAKEIYDKLLSGPEKNMGDSRAALLTLRAQCELGLNMPKEALADANAVLQHESSVYRSSTAYAAQARAYMALHQYQKAADSYTQALQKTPKDGVGIVMTGTQKFTSYGGLLLERAKAYDQSGKSAQAKADRAEIENLHKLDYDNTPFPVYK